MNVVNSSRSRSGLAWASCSSSRRAGSILGVTVIVVSFFESVFADHSKDHPMAVAHVGSDTLTGIRTPLSWTSLQQAPPDARRGCRAALASPGGRVLVARRRGLDPLGSGSLPVGAGAGPLPRRDP